MTEDAIVRQTVLSILYEAGAARTEGEELEYSERVGNILLRLKNLDPAVKSDTLRAIEQAATTEWLQETNAYLDSNGFTMRF